VLGVAALRARARHTLWLLYPFCAVTPALRPPPAARRGAAPRRAARGRPRAARRTRRRSCSQALLSLTRGRPSASRRAAASRASPRGGTPRGSACPGGTPRGARGRAAGTPRLFRALARAGLLAASLFAAGAALLRAATARACAAPRDGHAHLLPTALHPAFDTSSASASASASGPYVLEQRVIWLLWLDGWAAAPWLVREAARSWAFHNPGWSVVLLDNASLEYYVSIDKSGGSGSGASGAGAAAARAARIRLQLLATHGGVWADAGSLCMAPLDGWLHAAVAPAGVWAYRSGPSAPAPGFLAASRHSALLRRWRAAADAAWAARSTAPRAARAAHRAPPAAWADAVFAQLLRDDVAFAADWARVPSLEARNQSLLLHGGARGGAHLRAASAAQRALLAANPPYVLKLSREGLPADVCSARFAAWQAARAMRGVPELEGTAAFAAVQAAFARRDNVSHAMQHAARRPPAPERGSGGEARERDARGGVPWWLG
jgi:hypothetical protein